MPTKASRKRREKNRRQKKNSRNRRIRRRKIKNAQGRSRTLKEAPVRHVANRFYDLSEDLQQAIYSFDPTYHGPWRRILFDRPMSDSCGHGRWSTCPHPRCRSSYLLGTKITAEIEEEEYRRYEDEEEERLDRLYERRWGF